MSSRKYGAVRTDLDYAYVYTYLDYAIGWMSLSPGRGSELSCAPTQTICKSEEGQLHRMIHPLAAIIRPNAVDSFSPPIHPL